MCFVQMRLRGGGGGDNNFLSSQNKHQGSIYNTGKERRNRLKITNFKILKLAFEINNLGLVIS